MLRMSARSLPALPETRSKFTLLRRFEKRNPDGFTRFVGALWVLTIIAVCTGICFVMFPYFERANLIMIYLVGVVVVATRLGQAAAIGASVLSVAAFDFFFVPPYLTLVVEDAQYILTFFIMLSVAIVISRLTLVIQKQSEETRRSQLAVETEQLRNAVLSSVSHDLRTPLAGITGAASSLLDKKSPLDENTQQELLQTIYDEAARLNRLVTNLLDMTRLEAGVVEVKKEWQPLEEVIGTALARLESNPVNLARVSSIRVDLPEDLPLVPLDGVLIEQVLINLLENALKYTPNTSAIEIAATAQPQQLTVSIADQGPGVPAGEEERIFGKFYRATMTSDTVSGAGLGLAICRGIIQAHGGRIWVEPCPNRASWLEGQMEGAIFRFTLPINPTVRPEANLA